MKTDAIAADEKDKKDKKPDMNYPSSYREVKIGKTLYCVTSIFTGEKELGPTLEKLAIHSVLEEMDAKVKDILSNDILPNDISSNGILPDIKRD